MILFTFGNSHSLRCNVIVYLCLVILKPLQVFHITILINKKWIIPCFNLSVVHLNCECHIAYVVSIILKIWARGWVLDVRNSNLSLHGNKPKGQNGWQDENDNNFPTQTKNLWTLALFQTYGSRWRLTVACQILDKCFHFHNFVFIVVDLVVPKLIKTKVHHLDSIFTTFMMQETRWVNHQACI